MVSEGGDLVERETQRLVKAITSGVTNLLALIESMGTTLNSEEMIVRREALDTLAEVIRTLPINFLNESEVAPLLAYFNAQLKGHPDHSRAAIVALKALFERQPVPSEAVGIFVERFFNETALVDLTRSDKMHLYEIFNRILTTTSFLEVIRRMHSAFLPGFLQLVELETDPQCLMLCFSMFQIVAKHFPLGVYADDMFEYPAAYFPIDFNAPPERHGGVTREKLQEAVEQCLLCHTSFEEHVIKLCLEKLTSQLPEAQIDSLRLLKRAVLQYDAAIAVEYSQAIWPTLRMLFMGHRGEAQYEEAIFRLLTALAQKLSESSDWHGAVEKLAQTLWLDFEDVESFLDNSGWRFIVAFGGGSTRCANAILPKGFSKVTTLITEGQQQVNGSSSSSSSHSGSSNSLIDAACAMVHVVASLGDGFNDDTLRKCVEMLASQACALLLDASYKEHHVKLLSMLEPVLHIETAIRESERESIKRFVETSISASPSVPPRALKNFIAACNSQFGKEFSSELCRLAKQGRCVWLLAGLVDRSGENAEQICGELLAIRDAAALESVQEILIVHPHLAEAILDTLLSTFDEIADDVLQNYEDLLTIAVRSVPASVINVKLAHMQEKLNAADRALLIRLRVVLSNCPSSCLRSPTCSDLAYRLIEVAAGSATSTSTSCPVLSQCLALVANKQPESSGDGWLAKCLQGDALAVSYVTKALLMRNHKLCEQFMDAAIGNVTERSEGPASFAVVVKPEPRVFPRDGGCTVRILYPQRFMTFAMPKLLTTFEGATDAERILLSGAVCLSLYNVSPELAEKFASQLRPVILWCLSHAALPSDSSLGLLQCVRRNFSQLQLTVNAVIPPLVRWSQRPSPMQLRIEALSCLHDLRKFFEVHHLLPHKRSVLKALPIGDRKRLVRRAAAQTSVTWHMLGEA